MYIKQLYTSCLSEAAYYIESNGEAAIIDPLRDIDVYLQLAAERKSKIKYIFETHFHADFVSGHIDLSKATGASIVYGPGTVANFPVYVAKDKETAISYLDKVLAIEPENADALRIKEILTKVPKKEPAAKPKSSKTSKGSGKKSK